MGLISKIVIIILCLFFEICAISTVSAQDDTKNSDGVLTRDDLSKKISQQDLNPNNLIHFGDLIEIDVVGSVDFDWRGKLNPEGFISGITHLEEPVYALCQSEESLANLIADRYAEFLVNPQIIVRILDKSGRPVAILSGAIKTPAKYQIQRQVKLNELIINAGGFNENASGEVEILRSPGSDCSNQTEKEARTFNIKISDLISGEENANPYILSGDYITVKKAQPIYVIGNIIEPRRLDSRANLTVSRAVAAAGGFAKNSDLNKILVYRVAGGASTVIEVDFRNLRENDPNDIKLEPLDVVEVLTKGAKRRTVAPVVETRENNSKNIDLPLKVMR